MATKFYLAEIPDDFPATNVKFENMTKPLLAIPPKMVDGKPITIVGYIVAGQKKYKANDYGFVEFNDNGADFAQFKDANMDTRYSVREKVSGDMYALEIYYSKCIYRADGCLSCIGVL